MKDIRTKTGRITQLLREPSSANGNPRWTVLFTDDNGATSSFKTTVDSSLGYGIQSAKYRGRVEVEVGSHYGVPSLNDIRSLEGEDNA